MFESTLWERIVLQASHSEHFVRDAVVAIGALSNCGKWVESTASKSLVGTPHYRFALAQYGRAVKKMRATIARNSKDIRKALIGCLLVICFEAYPSVTAGLGQV